MAKLNINEIGCREWDMVDIVSHMTKNIKCWSWGIRNFANYQHKVLRFRVSGHHHKGYVYISLNFMDTFDVYFTNLQNEIKQERKEVYIDELINTIDRVVEYIPDYRNN